MNLKRERERGREICKRKEEKVNERQKFLDFGEQQIFFDPSLKLSLMGSLFPSSGGKGDKRCHYPPHGNESFQMTQEVNKRKKRKRQRNRWKYSGEESNGSKTYFRRFGLHFVSLS